MEEKKTPIGYIITIVVLLALVIALFITLMNETDKQIKASISYSLLESSYEDLKEENELLREKTTTDWIEFLSYKTAFEFTYVFFACDAVTAKEFLQQTIDEYTDDYEMSLYENQQYTERVQEIVADFSEKAIEMYG